MSGEPRTYTCASCGGTFDEEWTEAEAQAEAAANGWGDVPMSEMAKVCDDCYEAMVSQVPPPSWVRP